MVKIPLLNEGMYWAETWSMNKVDIRRLEAFKMWTGRRMSTENRLDGTSEK